MSGDIRARLGLGLSVWTSWVRGTAGRWTMLMALLMVEAALFHPLYLLVGAVIGVVIFATSLLGGVVLGPRQGALFGLLTGLLGDALWGMEFGFTIAEGVSGPLVNLGLGFLGGSVRSLVVRELAQSHALKRANDALRATQMELLQAERLALFGEVAAGVAHELNQPLAIIGLAAEMAERHLTTSHPDGAARNLAKIQEQVQRASRMIQRLKSTGKISGDEERRDCDLNAIVRAVLPQFEPQFGALGIDLECDLEHGLPPVNCRSHQIQQVLIYLLLNARDAVQNTSVKQVRVRSWRENEMACIEVSDTGAGMTEAVRTRAFDPFFTTKEVGKGSGLGLPISYRLVHGHGGMMRLESQPDEGTRILIQLPFQGRDRAPSATVVPPPTAGTG